MRGEGYEEHILYRGYGRIGLRTVVVEHILADMRMRHSCFVVRIYSIEVVDGHVVVDVVDTDDVGFDEYFELVLEGSSLIHQSSSLRDPFVLVEHAESVEHVEHVKLE